MSHPSPTTRAAAWTARLCVAVVVAVLAAPTVQAQADGDAVIVKVPLDSSQKILLTSPFPDCRTMFWPSGYDSNLLQIKGVSDKYAKKTNWRLEGIQAGLSALTVNWQTMSDEDCSFQSGSFDLDLRIGYDLTDATKLFSSVLRSTQSDVRDQIREQSSISIDALKDIADILKQVSQGELEGDIKYYLEHAFDALLCCHSAMITDSTWGLMSARDTGTNILDNFMLDELCKGPAFSDGECGLWDRAVTGFASDVRAGLSKVGRAEKQFYRSVERYTDLNIAGVARLGYGLRLPGPVGYDTDPLDDPIPRLQILNAWSVGNIAGDSECIAVWIGGMGNHFKPADGLPSQVRVILTRSNDGGTVERTASMDGYGKWYTVFDEKDGLVEGSTLGFRVEYVSPDEGEEDFDEMYLALRAQFQVDF